MMHGGEKNRLGWCYSQSNLDRGEDTVLAAQLSDGGDCELV